MPHNQAHARLLVAEDDPTTAASMFQSLREAGFDVELVANNSEALRRALAERFDAVILDLVLSQGGFEVIERIRHRTQSAIIVLSAQSELADRLRAFELGAVDFMAKPFWVEELVARVQSRLRAEQERPRRMLHFSEVTVDLEAGTAEVGGRPAGLTRTEFAILAFLAGRPGRAVSRSVLASQALASFERPDTRTVDSHVARLRKKLGTGSSAIVTVWGIGYRFNPLPREPLARDAERRESRPTPVQPLPPAPASVSSL
jgi:two-component system OmpR family response regulator